MNLAKGGRARVRQNRGFIGGWLDEAFRHLAVGPPCGQYKVLTAEDLPCPHSLIEPPLGLPEVRGARCIINSRSGPEGRSALA